MWSWIRSNWQRVAIGIILALLLLLVARDLFQNEGSNRCCYASGQQHHAVVSLSVQHADSLQYQANEPTEEEPTRPTAPDVGWGADDWIAAFTFALTIATLALFGANIYEIETGKRQSRQELRAYVGIDLLGFEITSDEASYKTIDLTVPGTIYPDFIVTKVRNFGKTPAKNVCVLCSVAIVPLLAALPKDFDFDAQVLGPRPNANVRSHAYLQERQAETIKSAITDTTHIWAARRRELTLIIYGRIFYEDAFDQKWSTKFCYEWEPWHPPGERFVPYVVFNGEDRTPEPT